MTQPEKPFSIFVTLLLSLAITSAGADELGRRKTPAFKLGEIVVIGERVNLATTFSEVTAAEMRRRGVQTVGEALELLAGIDVQKGGKGQSLVKIRGFEAGDVKILLDGVPLHECYSGIFDLSAIPVESIAKIRVTKGASSVLYGVNTMGGVINIITKPGGNEPLAQVSTSFGDYGTQNYSLNYGGKVGRCNLFLTYGYRKSAGYRLSANFDPGSKWVGENSEYHEDGGKRELSNYQKRTLNIKIGYQPNKPTQFCLSFDYYHNERGCPVERNRYWWFSQWDQSLLNLVGERRLRELSTVKVRGFWLYHRDELTDDAQRTISQGGESWFDRSLYKDYTVGGELHSRINLWRSHLLKIGIGYVKDKNKQREYNAKNRRGEITTPGWGEEMIYEADTYTLGLEEESKPIEKLSLVLGLSYDYFNPLRSGDVPTPGSIETINPQAGLVYNIATNTLLHISLGKKTRFPHLKELYSTHAGGNPDLKPQRTIAYEMGGETELGRKINYRISLFHNDVQDLIQRVEDAEGKKIYANIGSAIIQGVEMGLKLGVPWGLWLGVNYTYLSARDEQNDRTLENRPSHKLNLDLHGPLFFGSTLTLGATYVGSQYDYSFVEKTLSTRRIPPYLLLDARLTKSFTLPFRLPTEAFLSVKNLTDKDYDEGNGPMPGRNFLVGLTIRH